ncbi:MAG: SMI1/KNR4 family protein [Phycisphaeraceae bacterium]
MVQLDRIALYQAFVDRFRSPDPSNSQPVPIAPDEVHRLESKLHCRLPASYHALMTHFGAADVRLLSDLWLDRDSRIECPVPMGWIWSPERIVSQCEEPWLAPIPSFLTDGAPIKSDIAWKHLIPFATEREEDNWFCFRRVSTQSDDQPVYFFDHDGGDIEQISSGLDELLRRYLELPVTT